MGRESQQTLLELKDVKKYFLIKNHLLPSKRKYLKAVDGFTLNIHEGDTVGLVGESGCGKSTLGRTILRLHSITSGSIKYKGNNLEQLNFNQMHPYRKEIQMIFQDPYASLNPRRTLFQAVIEPLEAFKVGTAAERKDKATTMLNYVGIGKEHFEKYPHELSGGQRQRVIIARSVILEPKFIVCDEPVSALDVSVRSQVLNLMKDLQQEKKLSYLFISHDLSVVRYLCDFVVVMYLGKIVEMAEKHELFDRPTHPYSKALISAIPIPDVHRKFNRIVLRGDVPSPINPPSGCVFHQRCTYVNAKCKQVAPQLRELRKGHSVACHYAEKLYG
ncbi:MAG: ABC transporter ATP-binding protein [Dethiobacteria bacterium]|jgi:oligopeptide/dipeptide ABC transporter ATP-binding protein